MNCLGTLSWIPQGGRAESLYAATGIGVDPEALTQLLIHARRALANHSKLSLDYPGGDMVEAISAAGFQRTSHPVVDARLTRRSEIFLVLTGNSTSFDDCYLQKQEEMK